MLNLQATKVTQMIANVLKTDGTTATANLDMKGYDYATVIVNLGLEEGTDATNPTVALSECDTTVLTDFATVFANVSVDLQTARDVVYHVDMRGRKRYLQVSITAGTGTGNDIKVGAIGIQSRAEQDPASTTDMIASTNDVIRVI